MWWWQHWRSSNPDEKAELQARYTSFAGQHGELYEDMMVPLTAEQIEEVIVRRNKFKTKWLIWFIAVAAFVLAGVIFAEEDRGNFFLGSIALLVVSGGGGWIWYNNFNKILRLKEMRVIKGVVTDKQMVRKKGCFLEISTKEIFQVMPEDYKTLTLGDIIRMEILSDDIYIKRKIVLVGRI